MRQILRLALLCLATFGLVGLHPGVAPAAPRNEAIYDFTGGDDGVGFATGITVDRSGAVYGVAPSGGGKPFAACQHSRCGRIFRLLPPATQGGSWTYQALYDLAGDTDGDLGATAPTLDEHGNVYGVSPRFGGGSIWRLSPSPSRPGGWNFTVLYRFTGYGNPGATDGYMPTNQLARDRAGNLFGRACAGGASGHGTVFELSPPRAPGDAWSLATLYAFTFDGGFLGCGLPFTLSADGHDLFGVEPGGRISQRVFDLRQTVPGGPWSHRVLIHLADLDLVQANLLVDDSMNLFGIAKYSLFRLSPPQAGRPGWSRVDLLALNGLEGGNLGLLRIASGRGGAILGSMTFGGEFGNGLTWRADPPAAGATEWSLTTLHSFIGEPFRSQPLPRSGLVAGPYQNFGGVFYPGGRYFQGGIYRQTTR